MTTTGTVSGMHADGQPRADHGPYIVAVRRALEALDIQVVSITVTSTAGRREANLELLPDQDAFAEPMPAHASAHWHEDSGWQLLVPREALASHEVSEGTSVLPAPQRRSGVGCRHAGSPGTVSQRRARARPAAL